jgi:Flp pilus assembly protein TadG
MAIVLPVILMMLLGTIDVAQLMYAYTTVSEAARGGARYAIVHGSMAASPVGPTANDTTVDSVARTYAPALNGTRLTVTSSWGSGTNDAGNPVTVTVTYQCQLATTQLIGLGTVNVKGTTTMLITH